MNAPPREGSDFPDPVYKDTVLAPLFEDAKTYYLGGFRRINRAHLVMLSEAEIVTAADAGRIARALVAIDQEVDLSAIAYTGQTEDLFFLIEAELTKRIGPDVAGRLHTARSRNDIDHTLFRLKLKAEIDALLVAACGLAGTLIGVSRRESGTIVLAYTHGQPAQPTTYGHYLAAVLEVLLRDIERLVSARGIVDLCPMGAAAITTTGFPIDRALTAELLGFSRPTENSYGSIAAVDYVTAAYGALALLFLHLGRPIQDLQFWTSFEVGQARVSDAFVQVSSIMPQKRNPVPIEHLRHLASQTVGRANAVLGIMHNTPFTDMNDNECETQVAGYQAFRTAHRVISLLTALVPALTIVSDRVAQNIRRSAATVTELADSLVRIEGLSFRQAHAIAAAVAKSVVGAGGDLETDGYQPFATAFEAAVGRWSAIDADRFAELVSAEHFIEVRTQYGGPAPAPMAKALDGYQRVLSSFESDAKAAAAVEAKAAVRLGERFAELVRGT